MTVTTRRFTLALMAGLILAICLFPARWPVRADRLLVSDAETKTGMPISISTLTIDERTRLLEREKQRLLTEPLDSTAFNNLAILESLGGDSKLADTLLLEAASRSLRDPLAQLAALQIGLDKADFSAAFRHLNSLLTVVPQVSQNIYPLVYQHLTDPKAVSALAAVLVTDPPWRTSMFEWIAKNDKDYIITYNLVSAVRKAGGRETITEMQWLLTQLVIAKQYQRAYYIWLDSKDTNELTLVREIYDGNFTQIPHNLYFDWNIIPTDNVTIDVANANVNGQRTGLQLNFLLSKKRFANVFQFMRLEPGKYTFEGKWQADNFGGGEGLIWTVVCLEGAPSAGSSEKFKMSAPPTPFAFSATVPTSGCDTQELLLASSSGQVLDQALDGTISFNHLSAKLDEKAQQ